MLFYDIDLDKSWCVGNSISDMEAGLRAGCKTILIDLPSHQQQLEPGQPRPDYKAVNIKETVNIIKKHHRSSVGTEAQTRSAPTAQTESVRQVTEQIPEAVEPASQAAEQIPETVEPVSQTTEQTPEVAEPVSHTEEQQVQSAPEEPQTQPPKEEIPGDRTEQSLNSILKQLKNMQRSDMFGEFSIMRLMAGIIQILVLFCLLMTLWFLMSPNRQDNSIFIALGFAMVLQVMSLTFYIMHGRK